MSRVVTIAPPPRADRAIEAQEGGLPAARVELRVRSPWQALDLGAALLRRHALVAYGAWFAVSLPFVALAMLLPLELRGWGVLLLWWMKPLFEQPIVLCLSRELFGQPMSLPAVLRAFLRSLSWQTFAALTWRRFALSRALNAPVALLEGARGAVRRQRLDVLHRGVSRHALLANITLFALEFYLALSFTSLFVALLPSAPANWSTYFGEWLPRVLPIAFCIAMGAVGPLHAASGFALYINRRCDLEAWDIEVGFRGLAQRIASGASVRLGCVLCACVLALHGLLPAPAWAGEPLPGSADASAASSRTVAIDAARLRPGAVVGRPEAATPVPGTTVAAGDAQASPLAKHASAPRAAPPPDGPAAARSRRDIATVLEDSAFHERAYVHYPASFDGFGSTEDEYEPPSTLPAWLLRLFTFLVEGAWWLMWGTVVLLAAFVAWRYRAWIAELFDRSPAVARVPSPRIVVAGVEIGASTHEDSEATARALWAADDARAALAMLLRLVLVDLAARGCRFRSGDTEADCLRAAEAAAQGAARIEHLRRLLGCWIPLAYAHRPPDDSVVARLFADHAAVLADKTP